MDAGLDEFLHAHTIEYVPLPQTRYLAWTDQSVRDAGVSEMLGEPLHEREPIAEVLSRSGRRLGEGFNLAIRFHVNQAGSTTT
ncbi:hypothetical protein GCM10027599_23430 [Yimella radicis]